MTDPIDHPDRFFRLDLDGGASVYAEREHGPTAGAVASMVTVRLPATRAHALSHLMQDWVSAFRFAPDRSDVPSTRLLGRAIEDAAAALGELGALACATRAGGSVAPEQRLAAVGVLRTVEPAMSPVARIAVVDAAARWMEEDAGDELAFALLRAACSSEVNASQAYVELISPAPGAMPAGGETGQEDEG
jgi:hypothetical protein